MQVFRKQADFLRRIDRQWQQVFDSLIDVLQECINDDGKMDARSGQSKLEVALEDFKFMVTKATETMQPI